MHWAEHRCLPEMQWWLSQESQWWLIIWLQTIWIRMHKNRKSNKIQVIIVHIKKSDFSTTNPLNGLFVQIHCLHTSASWHFQLSNTHPAVVRSTDIMDVGCCFSIVRYIKIYKFYIHVVSFCSLVCLCHTFPSPRWGLNFWFPHEYI